MRLSRSGFGLSVLIHALAFWGVTRAISRTPQYPSPPPLQAAIVWLALPEGAFEPALVEQPALTAEPASGAEATPHGERPAGRSERAARPSRRQRSESAIEHQPPMTPSRAPEESTAPNQDVVEARRRAAAEVLEDRARAGKQRSFEFPGTIAQQRAFDESERFRRREQGLGPPPSVFDSLAKGRAALPEERVVVYGVHWISDDCYVFREPSDRFIVMGLLIPPVPPTTCTRRYPRTDLFMTAKPSYLMGEQERAAVEAETQRRERLRRSTTGAVMPLAKD